MNLSALACAERRSAWRRLRLLGLGVATFLAAALVVDAVQGPLKDSSLRPQLAAFLAERDAFDAVIVGSSRIQRGVQPEVLDARLSAPGREFRSFNLGVAGMRSFEADRIVREILASRPARLRFLLIEAPDWRAEVGPLHMFTARYTDWHDAPTTWQVLRSLWRSGLSVSEKLELTWMHARLFATRLANYGTGDRFDFGADPKWQRRVDRMGEVQGYLPLETRRGNAARRRRAFLSKPGLYENQVARLRRYAQAGELAAPRWSATYDRTSLEEQVATVEEFGVVPVYLVPPLLTRGPDFPALAGEGLIPHVIDLRDPLTHPGLFDVANRFDQEHMSIEGAREMSEAIADQLEPLLVPRSSEGPG